MDKLRNYLFTDAITSLKRAVRIIAKIGYRERAALNFKEMKLLKVDQINELGISI